MERVAIYNRCSTEEEAQVNALAIQAEESREIAIRKGWLITAQYIESESGTTTRKRTEYQQMLTDMEEDLFDIVMIKSIDRLMRSAKDWYLFLGKLTEYGKRLYLYIDNKFYSPDDSLLNGIKAILAEEFSRELSKKIKNAHHRRQEKKTGLNITQPMFGWDKLSSSTYVLNKEEAYWYRLAFTMAEEGKGFYSIANYMYEQGVRGKKGKRIADVQWRKMIYSPRAHGTVVQHTEEYDFEKKCKVKIPPEEWIYMENALPPIVSKEYQEAVLVKIAERTVKCKFKDYTRDLSRVGLYPLSNKLYCGVCGQKYYRTQFSTTAGVLKEWKCSTALKNGRRATNWHGCDNWNVREDVLLQLVESGCRKQYDSLFGEQHNLAAQIMGLVKEVIQQEADTAKLPGLKKEWAQISKRKKILLEKLLNEVISDEEYQSMQKELTDRLHSLSLRMQDIEVKQASYNDCEDRMRRIQKALEEGEIIRQAQNREFLQTIDKIIIRPDKKIEIRLKTFTIILDYIYQDRYTQKRRDKNRQILELFRQNPNMTLREVAQILGEREGYVRTCVKQLKEMGKLKYQRAEKGKSGEWEKEKKQDIGMCENGKRRASAGKWVVIESEFHNCL